MNQSGIGAGVATQSDKAASEPRSPFVLNSEIGLRKVEKMNPFVFDKSHCTDFPMSPRQRDILSDGEKSGSIVPDGSDDQTVLLANAFLRFDDAGLLTLTPNALWVLEQHRMLDHKIRMIVIDDEIRRLNSNPWVGWKATSDYAKELGRSVSSLKQYLQLLPPDVFDRRGEKGAINLRQSAYDELRRNLS